MRLGRLGSMKVCIGSVWGHYSRSFDRAVIASGSTHSQAQVVQASETLADVNQGCVSKWACLGCVGGAPWRRLEAWWAHLGGVASRWLAAGFLLAFCWLPAASCWLAAGLPWLSAGVGGGFLWLPACLLWLTRLPWLPAAMVSAPKVPMAPLK